MLALAHELVGPRIAPRVFEVRHVIQIAVAAGLNEGPTTRFTGYGPTTEDAVRMACGKIIAADAAQAMPEGEAP